MTTTSAPTVHGSAPRSASATPAAAQPSRRVIDAPTRMFHWLFALSFVGAYLTAEGERLRMLHVTLGYTLAGLLVFRLVYGLVGPRQVRLSALWSKLSGGAAWLRSLRMRPRWPASTGGRARTCCWRWPWWPTSAGNGRKPPRG